MARGVEFTEEPTERPYGIDCGLRDPFGNQHPLRPALPPALRRRLPSRRVRPAVREGVVMSTGNSERALLLGGALAGPLYVVAVGARR